MPRTFGKTFALGLARFEHVDPRLLCGDLRFEIANLLAELLDQLVLIGALALESFKLSLRTFDGFLKLGQAVNHLSLPVLEQLDALQCLRVFRGKTFAADDVLPFLGVECREFVL